MNFRLRYESKIRYCYHNCYVSQLLLCVLKLIYYHISTVSTFITVIVCSSQGILILSIATLYNQSISILNEVLSYQMDLILS